MSTELKLHLRCDFPECRREVARLVHFPSGPNVAERVDKTRAELKRVGWTSRRMAGGIRDFCPDHSIDPQGAPSQ